MLKQTLSSAAALLAGCAVAGEVTIYAAPDALVRADGSTPQDAARFWDASLWDRVREALKTSNVTVELVPGAYYTQYPAKPDTRLALFSLGNDEHALTIRGAADFGSIFSRHPGDSRSTDPKSKNMPIFISLWKNCRNITLERLYFTGDGVCAAALQIAASRDITVRNCKWKDMRGVYYMASGANHGAENVTWENCEFENIGYDAHAHMLYNENGSRNLKVLNCRFTDAYGDFIRFRNRVDNVTVRDCTFIDNGKYDSSPMISFPLFIDFDEPEHHEYFSTGLTVENNTFIFKKKAPRNWMMAFHVSGYNPPGRQYLVSRADAEKTKTMSPAELRKFMDDRFGLQTSRIRFSGNRIENADDAVVYECWPKYGSEKQFPTAEYQNVFSLTRAFQNTEPISKVSGERI